MSEVEMLPDTEIIYADGYAQRCEVIRQLILTYEEMQSEEGKAALLRAVDRLMCSIPVVEPKSASVSKLKDKTSL